MSWLVVTGLDRIYIDRSPGLPFANMASRYVVVAFCRGRVRSSLTLLGRRSRFGVWDRVKRVLQEMTMYVERQD